MKRFSDYDVVKYYDDINSPTGMGFYFWVYQDEIVSPFMNGFNAICRWVFESPRFNPESLGSIVCDLYYTPTRYSHCCAKVDLYGKAYIK